MRSRASPGLAGSNTGTLANMAKKITLNLPIESINETSVKQFDSVFKKHKGNQHLNFMIIDQKEKLKLNMPSRSAKINITKELLDELNENEWSFKLN